MWFGVGAALYLVGGLVDGLINAARRGRLPAALLLLTPEDDDDEEEATAHH